MLYALCFLLALCGCQAALSGLRPPLEDEGEVYLYLQPFPQEAERLRFTLEGIFAVSRDGREIPLSISLAELKARDVRRQRLLAHGPLLPDSYVGLSFRIKRAVLKTEEGEADLLVPQTPVRIDFPFEVVRRKSKMISLLFKYKESITDGVHFVPVFSAVIPARPIVSLAGYVTNRGANNITVFDKSLGQVVGVIATGQGPAGMALDQRLSKLYVALSGDDSIEVIDVGSGESVDRLRLNTGDRPQELALTPDGRVLLSVNRGSNTVSYIDALSSFELARVNVGSDPQSIVIDPAGRRAFVFNTLSGTISVLDIPNRGVIATVVTDPSPIRGQFNRRGNRLYIIHETSSYLTVMDSTSLSVVRRFPVKMGMVSIQVDPRTDLVYLGRKNGMMVEAYEPVSFVPVDFIRTGGTIAYMAIDSQENNLYLVNAETNRLMVDNLVSKRMVYEIDVSEEPYWVSVMGER
jgi:YVTN family beta-propeller protein